MQQPTYDDVVRARELVGDRVRRTPVLEVAVDGHPVTLKLELVQHSGSFKVRGAFTNALLAEETPTALVAASGGNHGLAVAHVGRALGIPTEIFVPEGAPAVKVRAIDALGGHVQQVGSTYAEAFAASREAASRPGVLALHAYDSPGTVAGQGTLGLELREQVPDVDTVLVAVGGGGLVSGITLALDRSARVVAVEPETCPTLHAAYDAGEPVDVTVGGVAADALGASRLGAIAYDVAVEHDVASVLVTDEAITDARRWLWEHARIAAEPAGATALAAVLSGAYRPDREEHVTVVVCGGNADPAGL